MLEHDPYIQNFILFGYAEFVSELWTLRAPATPDLAIGDGKPHAYLEVVGGQIVGVEFLVSSLDGGGMWWIPGRIIEPTGAWEAVVIPLPLDELPQGLYDVSLLMGQSLPLKRRVRIRR